MALPRKNSRTTAFTLIELMVVVGLIVVMLLLALPAANFITGARSIESATNVVNAMLGTARAQAIATQSQVGLLFFWDKTTEQTIAAICSRPAVWDSAATYISGDVVEYPANSNTFFILPQGSGSVVGGSQPSPIPSASNLWIVAKGYQQNNTFMPVLSDGFDTQPLPKGIGIQGIVIPDSTLTPALMGTNPTTGRIQCDLYVSTACILFDGNGKLAFISYGIYAGAGVGATSRLGTLTGLPNNIPQIAPFAPIINNNMGLTQAGLVLYDHQAFKDSGYDERDYITGEYGVSPGLNLMIANAGGERNDGASPGPTGEEIALNGYETTDTKYNPGGVAPLRTTFLLVNRYNGTILKTD